MDEVTHFLSKLWARERGSYHVERVGKRIGIQALQILQQVIHFGGSDLLIAVADDDNKYCVCVRAVTEYLVTLA